MTIYSIKDLLDSAKYLPAKYKEGFTLKLEDMDEQLKVWTLKPEDLSKDESLHAGIVFLAKTLMGKKEGE